MIRVSRRFALPKAPWIRLGPHQMQCLTIQPSDAVEYGSAPLGKNQISNRQQGHHPRLCQRAPAKKLEQCAGFRQNGQRHLEPARRSSPMRTVPAAAPERPNRYGSNHNRPAPRLRHATFCATQAGRTGPTPFPRSVSRRTRCAPSAIRSRPDRRGPQPDRPSAWRA